MYADAGSSTECGEISHTRIVLPSLPENNFASDTTSASDSTSASHSTSSSVPFGSSEDDRPTLWDPKMENPCEQEYDVLVKNVPSDDTYKSGQKISISLLIIDCLTFSLSFSISC